MSEKTYIIETKSGVKRVTVPEGWKVTFGPLCPGSRGDYNGRSGLALRIYESKEKQRAVFTDVICFRDASLLVEEEVVRTKQQRVRRQTPEGERDVVVEAKLRDWRNADDPQEPDDEFLNLEWSGE